MPKKLKSNSSMKQQVLLELTAKRDILFIIGDWNAKVGSQEIPGVICKFGIGVQNEAGESITEFCQENTLVITNTLFQQHRRQLYTWTSPDGQYRNQNDYIICSWWWSSIKSAKTRLGADCGIEHEILIVKCRRKLKKVGKITRSCRYTAKSLQSCSTLCDPIDGSPPSSPIPGIL